MSIDETIVYTTPHVDQMTSVIKMRIINIVARILGNRSAYLIIYIETFYFNPFNALNN